MSLPCYVPKKKVRGFFDPYCKVGVFGFSQICTRGWSNTEKVSSAQISSGHCHNPKSGALEKSAIFLKPKFHYTGSLDGLLFFPDQEGLIENAEPQLLTFADGHYLLTIKNVNQSPFPIKPL